MMSSDAVVPPSSQSRHLPRRISPILLGPDGGRALPEPAIAAPIQLQLATQQRQMIIHRTPSNIGGRGNG